MTVGTSFPFVFGGIGAVLDWARDAVHWSDVAVSRVRVLPSKYFAAGLIDEVDIHLGPVCLSEGVRRWLRAGLL
jgi:hypothetical protein